MPILEVSDEEFQLLITTLLAVATREPWGTPEYKRLMALIRTLTHGSPCAHCDEPLEPSDRRDPDRQNLHYECGLRAVVGSAAHLEKRCSCYVPGAEEGDPPEMTRRQAAQLAAAIFHRQQREKET